MINAELFRNVELGECPPLDRLLYIGMIVNADDEGRLRANPKYLRATIFPFDLIKDEDILAMRGRLVNSRLINVYEVDGMEYLEHPKWEKWQILRKDRMKASDCPPSGNQVSTRCQPSGGHPAAEEKLTQEKLTQPNPTTTGATKRFSKPTPEEVTAFATSIGFELDGHNFVDHYESKGWLIGKSPMKDWHAAVRTWKRMRAERGYTNGAGTGGAGRAVHNQSVAASGDKYGGR